MDTHAHVIGSGPYNELRGYTPSAHPAEEYLRMLDTVGVGHGVLVQPTVHGTDNTVLLHALRKYPRRFRGVAVTRHDATEGELLELKEAGVVGLRLVASTTGGVGLQHIDRYESMCFEMGWHLQFMVDAHRIDVPTTIRLGQLRVNAIIDHMGHFPASEGPASEGARTMRRLLADGLWVKLSGAFRVGSAESYSDCAPVAKILIDAAPDRCLWGSDWPHVNFWKPMPSMSSLLDLLADWAPDAAQRDRILVDNAHRLYGFDTALR